MDFNEIFERIRGLYSEHTIRFWKTSVEPRPPPTSKGIITRLNNMITTDQVFIKILQDMDYENHPESADLRQAPAMAHLIRQ